MKHQCSEIGYTLLYEEYRNGVKIGEITCNCSSQKTFQDYNIGHIPTPNGYLNKLLQTNTLQYTGDDDANDVVRFRAYGKPFQYLFTNGC